MLNRHVATMPRALVNGQVTAVQQSFVRDLMARQAARSERYIQYREYYDGIHHTLLTDRMRQFLQVQHDIDFTANYCPMIVNAKSDRLTVTGFDVDDTQKDILWDWWRKNRMDRKQGIVHRAAVRDGDSFVLVEWDEAANMPRFHFEPAYTGDGVMVYYSDERRDEIEFASKYWRITHGRSTGKMRRLNLYFPNRIEKYISHDDSTAGHWFPYEDPDNLPDAIAPGKLGNAAIHWWTVGRVENGEPLGVPIVHFKHNDNGDSFGTSQLERVIPLQDAVNKALIDLLGAMDANGFPLLVGYGSDQWANIKVGPGAIAWTTDKRTDGTELDSLAPMSPDGLLKTYNALVMELARVTGTPLSYFQVSGQTPAEGTMKQQEIALLTQVKKCHVDFGNNYEDIMMMGRRLHNAFSEDPELDTDPLIETIWQEAEVRNEKEFVETLTLKVEKLGVSEEQAQIEMGYDATHRAAFARAALRRSAITMRREIQLPQRGNARQDDSENLTQTENEGEVDSAA